MKIIGQLSELYSRLRANNFANHNEESQAMIRANELEMEFKKMYSRKMKQKKNWKKS